MTGIAVSAPVRTSFGKRVKRWLLPVVPFVLLVLIWLSALALFDPPVGVLPSPAKVFQAPFSNSAAYIENVTASIQRLGAGFVVAATTGVIIGIAAGLSKRIADFFGPLVTFLSAISGIAWIPLAVAWFGVGTGMVVFIIWNAAFFLIFGNTMLGVRLVPKVFGDGLRDARGIAHGDHPTRRHPGSYALHHVRAAFRPRLCLESRDRRRTGWSLIRPRLVDLRAAGILPDGQHHRRSAFDRSHRHGHGPLAVGTPGAADDRAVGTGDNPIMTVSGVHESQVAIRVWSRPWFKPTIGVILLIAILSAGPLYGRFTAGGKISPEISREAEVVTIIIDLPVNMATFHREETLRVGRVLRSRPDQPRRSQSPANAERNPGESGEDLPALLGYCDRAGMTLSGDPAEGLPEIDFTLVGPAVGSRFPRHRTARPERQQHRPPRTPGRTQGGGGLPSQRRLVTMVQGCSWSSCSETSTDHKVTRSPSSASRTTR